MSATEKNVPEKGAEEDSSSNESIEQDQDSEIEDQGKAQETNVKSLDDERSKRWMTFLARKPGKAAPPKPTFANAVIAVRYALEWRDRLRYNSFSSTILVEKPLPWDGDGVFQSRQWNDHDNLKLTDWLQGKKIGIEVGKVIASDAVMMIAREREYHPVREYFSSLKWDGVKRLETWLRDYMGAPDNPYERMVGPKWIISGVARIMRPGCKADCVLMFIGDQGQGKSTALEALIGKDWFTDEIRITGGKDTAIQMAGKMLVEFSDLEGFHGRTAEELKAFLSRTTDRYRGVFGRYAEDHPRQGIFAGTTNQRTPLRDFTGNRRFWPVSTGVANVIGLRADRNQLWAEAIHEFNSGKAWWLETPEERALADSMAEESRETDEWQGLVEDYIAGEYAVRTVDILTNAVEIPIAKITRSDQMRVAGILHVLKWQRVRKNIKGTRVWMYERLHELPKAKGKKVEAVNS